MRLFEKTAVIFTALAIILLPNEFFMVLWGEAIQACVVVSFIGAMSGWEFVSFDNFVKNLIETIPTLFKSFFDVGGDDLVTGSKKIGKTVIGRVIYTVLEYWAAFACAGMIGLMKYGQLSSLQIFFAVWDFDLILALIVLIASEKSGQDITLGESFRRATNVIHSKSRIAGYFTFLCLIVNAIIWEGPVQIVVIFKKEFRTDLVRVLALVGLTAIQATFWTVVYSFGYDSVSGFIGSFF